MAYKSLKEFETNLIEESLEDMLNYDNQENDVFQAWQTPSFKVKVIGMSSVRRKMEPQSGKFQPNDEIRKGVDVEVFDMRKEKTQKGTFLSGTKNKDGSYSNVVILDPKTKKRINLKTTEVNKVD